MDWQSGHMDLHNGGLDSAECLVEIIGLGPRHLPKLRSGRPIGPLHSVL